MTTKGKKYSSKTIAIIVGVLYIIGTVSGALSGAFGGTIILNPDFLIKVFEKQNQFIIGALLVLTMGLALAMVPVVIYPIAKKHNEILALGCIVFRGALETITYCGIVVGWLVLIPISQEYVTAGASDASYLHTLGTYFLEAGDWSDRISTIVFTIYALMFYYMLYQAKLIPRWLSGWGFISAAVVFIVGMVDMFGVDWGVLWAPLALQEMVMAVWLIIKGFNLSSIPPEPA